MWDNCSDIFSACIHLPRAVYSELFAICVCLEAAVTKRGLLCPRSRLNTTFSSDAFNVFSSLCVGKCMRYLEWRFFRLYAFRQLT